MITNDKGIVELKHQVLREVCRLAWEDALTGENIEKIIHDIIPGPKPQYRCCIYKEREIVRGRVRLAMGLAPDVTSTSKNVVAVIPAACDDCPIQEYLVTDICRFCLGKACLNACRFGAITPGDTRMHIDPNKCKSWPLREILPLRRHRPYVPALQKGLPGGRHLLCRIRDLRHRR